MICQPRTVLDSEGLHYLKLYFTGNIKFNNSLCTIN